MMLGLWKSSKSAYFSETAYYESIQTDYEVRPQYYAYSLMTKHVPKGAETYPIDLGDDFALGTAFKGTDGRWVYVFANGNEKDTSFKLAFTTADSFDKYEYNEAALPTGDSLISASVEGQTGCVAFELAPQTVVVWKQK